MAWHDEVRTGIVWPVIAGSAALAVGFGAFGTWAATAPIRGAVIAPGKVVVEGRNRPVQHLEGGIVGAVLVEEGQRVRKGDPLLVLDGTQTQAQLNRLDAQLTVLEAMEARALAERDGADSVAFAAALLARQDDPAVARAVADQRAEFAARLDAHRAELAALRQRIVAQQETVAGDEAERAEVARQLELTSEEVAAFETLFEKGLTVRSRVLELRRAEADLKGRASQLSASIARARSAIIEAEETIRQTEGARHEWASARLSELRLQRRDAIEQMRAAEDVSDRTTVRAPASGKVMDLARFGPGAVVAAGQTILEIVPEDALLFVEARVRPQDIDEVMVGQEARLVFSALSQRATPPVPGEVVDVSADRLEDERTGEPYYLARLDISAQGMPGYDHRLVGPGQPVETFITTGERTLLAYLSAPFVDTLRRSLRE